MITNLVLVKLTNLRWRLLLNDTYNLHILHDFMYLIICDPVSIWETQKKIWDRPGGNVNVAILFFS